MSLIQVNNLSIGYDTALMKGLTLSIDVNDLLLIRGRNGTGKTTLLKTLIGEIIPFEGQVIRNLNGDTAYLPQSCDSDIPLSLTMKEILKAFNAYEFANKIVKPDFFSKQWLSASGGEKQKALILTQLYKKVDILFLDEPFNHLDSESINELMYFFRKLLDQEHVKSIVYISHVLSGLEDELSVKTLELK